MAACLLVMLALPAIEQLNYIGADAVARAGEMKALDLPDSSRVTLNTRTAIDTEPRHVRLRRGEAYFEVAKGPSHPFIVDAGPVRIRVLGTKFNVRIDGDQIIVGVTEGKVRLERPAGDMAPVNIARGQEVIVDGSALQTQVVDDYERSAWRRHEIVARRTPLRIIVRELNRYRTSDIYLLNSALGESRFSGVLRTNDPDDAVLTVKRALGLRSYALPTGQVLLY